MMEHCIPLDSTNLSLGLVHKKGMFIRYMRTKGRRQSFSFHKMYFPLKWITLTFHKALATKAAKGHHKLLFWQVTMPYNQGCNWDTGGRINSEQVQWHPVFSLVPASKQLAFHCLSLREEGREGTLFFYREQAGGKETPNKGFPVGFIMKNIIWICLHDSNE